MKPSIFSYESMGTHWSVSIWDKLDGGLFQKLQEEIIASSQHFDATYSRFKSSSLVTTLSHKTGTITVPSDFVTMLSFYKKLYKLSNQKFTPLVGTALSDMGYDPTYSLHEKGSIHPIPELEKAVTILNDTTIELHIPSLFDFGALGKGFFVEKIKQQLLQKNLKQFLVNGSGDISYVGNGTPITIGLEHPLDTSKVIGSIEMLQGSMCSSGSNRRAWGKFHHIIDPDSLSSPNEILASWVIADSAMVSDALATALFLVPPEYFQKEFSFEYLLLNKDMKVKRSEGFNATLY